MNVKKNSWLTPFLALLPLVLMPKPAHAENNYRFGVQAFYDRYEEPTPGVNVVDIANYGAVTADYIHSSNGYFTTVQTRGSYGKSDYKSVSGVGKGIPQYEGDLRVLTGVNIPVNGFGGIKVIIPYFGLGLRAFLDQGKGRTTNLGFFFYDRRIYQLYLPIGASWQFTARDLLFTPMIEFDPLILGKVNSRLSNGGTGDLSLVNTQRDGYGVRGELMVGKKGESYSWEAGPFFRYWDIDDSQLTFDAFDSTFLMEPENTRLQVGAALRVTF
jgi:hypothetical protein